MKEKPPTLDSLYQTRRAGRDNMAPHMDTLRALAAECETAVEFGVRRGTSTIALLCGVRCWLHSYDIDWSVKYAKLLTDIRTAAGPKWLCHNRDSRKAEFDETDLLLHDSLHTYAHVSDELAAHADKVKKYLIFHDVTSHGCIGQRQISVEGLTDEDKELLAANGIKVKPGLTTVFVPDPNILGIRPAIDELMIRDPSWHIKMSYPHSAGLLVLERR